jgi:hypothetical protein
MPLSGNPPVSSSNYIFLWRFKNSRRPLAESIYSFISSWGMPFSPDIIKIFISYGQVDPWGCPGDCSTDEKTGPLSVSQLPLFDDLDGCLQPAAQDGQQGR